MSREDAARLVADCKTDEELADALAKAGRRGFKAAAAARGYNCTEYEAIAELVALTEQQLDTVVGGKISQSDVPDNMLALLTALRAGAPMP